MTIRGLSGRLAKLEAEAPPPVNITWEWAALVELAEALRGVDPDAPTPPTAEPPKAVAEAWRDRLVRRAVEVEAELTGATLPDPMPRGAALLDLWGEVLARPTLPEWAARGFG